MALPQAGVQLVADGLSGFVGDMHKASGAVSDFGKTGASAGGDFNKGFSQVIIGGLRELGSMGINALADLGKAVFGFVKDSVNLAGDFQAGMLEFQAVAGKEVDTAGLEQFHDLFLQIGKDLPVSTSDVQQAAIELVKGGIDPATIATGGLRSSIQFAAAAMGGDLVGAAEISAKIVGGWAEVGATAAQKADLLAHSQDTLTKAANASSVGVGDLSLGLFNMQGNAKLAGISLDESVTALSLLAPNFSSAATAGTSLNNFITRLQPSTKPAIAAMQGLGLYTEEAGSAFYDQQGNFVGWAETAQLLQDATGGLTDAQKQQIFQTIFGNDAMGAAAELTRQGADGYRNMAAALAEANGVQENAALKQAGFNTSLDNAKGSIEAVQIQLGERLLPILGNLLDNYVTPAINAFGNWASAILDAEDPIDALVDAADQLVPGIRSVVEWFERSGDSAGGLGGVLVDLSDTWDNVLYAAEAVGKGYMAIAQAILPIVTEFWRRHGDEIMEFIQKTYDSIIRIVNAAIRLYEAIFPPILNAVAGFFREHGDDILHILEGAWKIISGVIEGALALILGIIQAATKAIQGDWQGAWESIQQMSVDFTLALWKVITGFLDMITGFFGTSLQEIADLWLDNWNQLVDIVSSIDWGEVGWSVVHGIIAGLTNAGSSLVDAAVDLAKSALNAALEAIGAGSPAREWMPVGEFSIMGWIAGIRNLTPQLLQTLNDVSDEVLKQAEDLAASVQDALSGLSISGFQSEASIDRQKLKNMKAIDDLSAQSQESAKLLLTDAQNIAAAMTDPKQAAAFFKQRSEQIFELARLTDQINATTDRNERERLIEQYQLINAAQIAETKALDAQIKQGGEVARLAEQLSSLLSNPAVAVNDTGPGAALMQLLNLLQGSLQAGIPSVPQPTTNNYYYGQMGNTYSMPVQTNMTQDAIAQSWAIMGALAL